RFLRRLLVENNVAYVRGRVRRALQRPFGDAGTGKTNGSPSLLPSTPAQRDPRDVPRPDDGAEGQPLPEQAFAERPGAGGHGSAAAVPGAPPRPGRPAAAAGRGSGRTRSWPRSRPRSDPA